MTADRATRDELFAEVERLNKWADSFSDAQLKERRLCEERIREIEAARDRALRVVEAARDVMLEQSRYGSIGGTVLHTLALRLAAYDAGREDGR